MEFAFYFSAGVAVAATLMVITNILEGGSFDSDLASAILNSEQAVSAVLDNVVQTIQSKNYTGLDIDFEYIYPSDREAYNRFVQRAVDRLHPLGYTVTTALAPKISADQRGLLYEAHDYAFHGATVDHIILMTYEWGYTYSPPRAVAPVNLVEEVLQYAVTEIPSRENPDGDTELRVQLDAAVCSGVGGAHHLPYRGGQSGLKGGGTDNV